MMTFHLDATSGVPAYLQLVQQVKRALRLGMLDRDDQLPTVKEVVGSLAINPNTVLKAYRELEREGLVVSRPGQGTFIKRALPAAPPADLSALRRGLLAWLRGAREAGLDAESVLALFMSTFRDAENEEEVSA
jgi:GntR family transcriptional regulator